jgi:hypothetical protein
MQMPIEGEYINRSAIRVPTQKNTFEAGMNGRIKNTRETSSIPDEHVGQSQMQLAHDCTNILLPTSVN